MIPRDRLASIVGDRHVLTEPDVTAGYAVDWTGRFRGSTPAVVRPGSTEEVAAVVQLCNEHGIAVVPQGGNTGLVGGSVPLDGEVVLSLRRLDAIGEVDRLAAQVTAGAGVTLAALQRHADTAGVAFGIDLAARDSATVGGMIATNAGGTRFLRYGPMRAQVMGIEAVLADGRVISHMAGLAKDNTGYDLAGLLTGCEGTLAVVTAARLRLVPRFDHRVTALIGLPGTAAALEAVAHLRARLASLEAAELFFADGLDLVGLPSPLRGSHDAYLLIECAAATDPTDELAAALADVDDVAVATTPTQRAALWQLRERHTDAINAIGVPHKLDVTLPARTMAEFVDRVRGLVEPPLRCYLFGHIADGNLHVNVVGVDGTEPPDTVDDAVLRLVGELGGSISAEHGIGRAKRQWLHLNRSPTELDVFRTVKRALDPNGILNPAVLVTP